jgi:hypothetical protein
LTLAHQYIAQLDEDLRKAVFGNVGTIIAFKVGAEDAVYLEREFYPEFTKEDLMNLDKHRIYLKLTINGKRSKPFSAVTLPNWICFILNKKRGTIPFKNVLSPLKI